MDNDPILITGCSTGIGRAAAIRLAKKGHRVYASARRLETVTDIPGCEPLRLDVTDETSMQTAVERINQEHGSVGSLVNNAGYGLHGAFETTDIDEARTQFETNFFGLARLTQLVLPAMRAAGRGRIVNISSMGGRFTFPGGAFYHASKHAVEAMSDALRFEVAGFGIEVVVIEPGVIKTPFVDTAIATVQHSEDDDDPYSLFNQDLMLRFDSAYRGTISRFAASSPEAVAKVIERAIAARRPRTRYVITAGARYLLVLRRILPDRVFDHLLRSQYVQPR
ncbi:MAG: oxidoreductase [Actinomycetota bacterium]|nr:oxidoreductase [Actinomycetota bacterium]